MSAKRHKFISFALISSLFLLCLSPAKAANPDDGYPEGMAAPGRTCPNSELGFKSISDHSGKDLVCTLIDGVKKWWIDGEALPTSPQNPTSSSETNTVKLPEFQYTPKYRLPKKSLSKMKIFENVTYSTKSPSQHLDIYMPKGVTKPPLLIWTNGGGFVIGDENSLKFDDSAKMLEVFIKNGVAVASVNYRLAQEAIFPAAGVDTKSAIRFLRANASRYGYDPTMFATGGGSAGAYLALMAAITGDQASPFDDPSDPNRKISASVSAVIDLFGNADFFEMTSNNIKYPCDQSKNPFPVADEIMHPWFGDTTDPKVQAAMKSGGLYPYLKKSKKMPVFYIFHGSDDCSVSPYDSRNLNKAVKGLNGRSNLTIVSGAIHGDEAVWKEVMKSIPAIKKTLLSAKKF
jgi:acetyl esterase/lipase